MQNLNKAKQIYGVAMGPPLGLTLAMPSYSTTKAAGKVIVQKASNHLSIKDMLIIFLFKEKEHIEQF